MWRRRWTKTIATSGNAKVLALPRVLCPLFLITIPRTLAILCLILIPASYVAPSSISQVFTVTSASLDCRIKRLFVHVTLTYKNHQVQAEVRNFLDILIA
jgi:hypothetical protein